MQTVIQNLPVGVTLILEVGDKEKFASRYIMTAEREIPGKVTEHLLDGQQRLTAFWRTIHNNYEGETYFIYIPEFDTYNKEPWSEEPIIFCRTRYIKDNQRYPLWADNPKSCFARGCIPLHLLIPADIQSEIDEWVEIATVVLKPRENAPNAYQKLTEYFATQKKLKETILEYREVVSHFNLPFLALPNTAPKEVALQVFINMNTNSKPLTVYDYIVAEVESVKGTSLHKLQEELNEKYPAIKYYFELEFLILATSALLQDKLPNNRGMFNMDKEKMVENWELMENCLGRMATFMESQGIFDRQRLPTNAVLAVIAASYAHIQEAGDFTGKAETLLKKYLWSSFFTDRYENAAATKAFYDYIGIKRVLTVAVKENGEKYTEDDIPVLNRKMAELADIEELITVGWPKKVIIRARGILAITTYLGALDFADGQKATREHLQKREYHHIFPESLLQNAGIEGSIALNCALVTETTNKILAAKDPLKYLKERYDWSDPDIVNYRLHSHLIPVRELSNGGYDGLNEEEKNQKIKQDFYAFIKERARLIHKAVDLLTQGKDITTSMVMQEEHREVNWNELIAKGESKTVEFKSTLRYCLHRKSPQDDVEHSSFKTIAAFLNSEGGHLFVGVDDQGNVLGLEDDFSTFKKTNNKEDAFLQFLDSRVFNYFRDNTLQRIIKVMLPKINDRIICVISVQGKANEAVWLQNKMEKREQFYIRRAASTVELSPRDAAKYITEHWD